MGKGFQDLDDWLVNGLKENPISCKMLYVEKKGIKMFFSLKKYRRGCFLRLQRKTMNFKHFRKIS